MVVNINPYGSDKSGLVFGYLFGPGASGRPISGGEAIAWLARADADVGGLALPINISVGLFGMNVGGVPLAQNEQGSWIVVGLVAAFTVAALWLVFRRRRE